MTIPHVISNADVVLSYLPLSQSVVLGATASPGPIVGWRWTILSVPPGSYAHVGTKGSFVNGTASIQNPTLLCDASIDGGYTVQCVATNADGDSDPFIDRKEGQQAVIVRTSAHQLWLPGDYLYDWGEKYLNPTLRRVESLLGGGTPGHHATTHQDGGGDEVATDVPAVGAIPKADTDAKLDLWVSEKRIAVEVGSSAGNYYSSVIVPPGAEVLSVSTDVRSSYSGSAAISVTVDGVSPLNIQTSLENNPGVSGVYVTEPHSDVGSLNTGVVKVALGGTPSAGAARVIVHFIERFLT
jgi:hypothetical protein